MRYKVIVALGVVAVLAVVAQCAEIIDVRANHRATLKENERLAVDVQLWQAKYAEAASTVQRDVDTVKVRITSVRELRDTLNIRDTIQVLVYLDRADSALHACTDLANSCQLFRITADSTMRAFGIERDAWRSTAEREARRQKRQRWLTYGAFVGGAVLGAWVRGQP